MQSAGEVISFTSPPGFMTPFSPAAQATTSTSSCALRDLAEVLDDVESRMALKESRRVQSPQRAGNTVIDLSGGEVLPIQWINLARLSEGDFIVAA